MEQYKALARRLHEIYVFYEKRIIRVNKRAFFTIDTNCDEWGDHVYIDQSYVSE